MTTDYRTVLESLDRVITHAGQLPDDDDRRDILLALEYVRAVLMRRASYPEQSEPRSS
jgi:hypothetical protein